MGLERRVQNIKSLCKKSLLGAILISSLCIGCKKETSTGVEDNGPRGNPPATPSFMQVIPTAQEPNRGTILLIYDASDNEDGFRIERKKEGEEYRFLTTLPKNTERYVDWENIEMSTRYTYRIRAFNEFGNSDWNEETETSVGPRKQMEVIYPVADAYVNEENPTRNYGSDTYLFATNKPSKGQRSYLKFPYNEIPEYAIEISSAELRLFCQNEPGVGGLVVYVDDLAVDWSETNVTWNNKPFGRGGAADWANVLNNGQPVYWDITPFVRRWFEGVTLNHGLELFTFSDDLAVLYSREREHIGPLLTVEYLW